MIKFPIQAKQNPGARFAHLIDGSGTVIAGCLLPEDAEDLAKVANAGAVRGPIAKPARRKSKREMIADELRESDPLAQLMERDEIVYGPHDQLPQCGEHVARLKLG